VPGAAGEERVTALQIPEINPHLEILIQTALKTEAAHAVLTARISYTAL